MKKKLALLLLSAATAVCCAFGLAACFGDGDNGGNGGNGGNTGDEQGGNTEQGENTGNEQGGNTEQGGSGGGEIKQPSKGLLYRLSEDETYYSCLGIGTATDTDIIIADFYNGLHVTNIGWDAFEDCSNLTSVTIPDSVTNIGSSAFRGCSSLTSIIIPDSVTYIGDNAFNGCSSLTSIAIPDSVTYIGDNAFTNTTYYCDDKNWQNEVLYIGKHLIEAKQSIAGGYQIKGGTLTIVESAFWNCSSLTSVTIGNSVRNIGKNAFAGCGSLTSITIPDSVRSIDWGAFSNCSSLTSVYFVGDVNKWTEIEGLNELMASSRTLYINGEVPTSIKLTTATKISNYAFFDCSSLASITIGNSVTSIGISAFAGCSGLTSITIPDSVTSIGSGVFAGCSSLTNITFNGTKVRWRLISKDFDWNYKTDDITIHCTDGDLDKDGNEIKA